MSHVPGNVLDVLNEKDGPLQSGQTQDAWQHACAISSSSKRGTQEEDSSQKLCALPQLHMQLVQRHSTMRMRSIQQKHTLLRTQIGRQRSTAQMKARQLRHRLLLQQTGTRSNKQGLLGWLLCT